MRNISILGVALLCTACGGGGGASANPPTTTTTPTTNIPTTPATQPATMQGMLETHNQVRASVGVNPLTWSSNMSSYAQEWANHLANENNCQMQHRSAAGANTLQVGENIYWASPLTIISNGVTSTQEQAITATQVANDWASEKAYYDYASNTCASGQQCGHYTQMVWNTTLEVGCGKAICPDKGQIWVCNYNPPGNWVGVKPY